MSETVKPCPFCGRAPYACQIGGDIDNPSETFVWCLSDSCANNQKVYKMSGWNRRAAPEPSAGDRERARKFWKSTPDPFYVVDDLAALLAEVRAEERERCAEIASSHGDVIAKRTASRPHETEAHAEGLRMANEIYSIAAAIRKEGA